ncbi:MAG: glycoside hydrolase family 3 C-terminal domain-containing protein [Clostridia bacterium]|nr:glycoside hydrolase family 3 C-terminal domain-containing protein [Clostridia bacterium]
MELFNYEREHLERLRAELGECCVLLKSNGKFPIDKPCKIGAYGNGVRHTVKGGTGSGEVNSRFFVTVEEGLKNAGFEITSDKWLDSYDMEYRQARERFVKRIKREAKEKHQLAPVYAMGRIMPEPEYNIPTDVECDTAIYVLSRISGEGADREFIKGDILPTETEIRDILELNEKCDRFMLVLNVGGVIDLSELSSVSNILLLSQLGTCTGDALADLLLGKSYPSGKLTTTWASESDYEHIEFGNKDDTRYREGIYVGYRFFDMDARRVLFPFGYGLSYTEFDIKKPTVCQKNGTFTVNTRVVNMGAYPGKEVLQCYISSPRGRLDKPLKELWGFAKTGELLPGESTTVSMELRIEDMASYDESTESYILEAGNYIVYIGNSSRSLNVAFVINLDSEAVVYKAKNLSGEYDFDDPEPPLHKRRKPDSETPVFTLSPEDMTYAEAYYIREEKIETKIKELTDVSLAYLNVGHFNPHGGILSVIGNASSQVAGGAGETTDELKDMGIPQIVMADGPSGLRLSREFYRDKKGKVHSLSESGIPDSVLEYLPGILKKILKLFVGKSKLPKDCSAEYQYATALPIGTAVAQSWSTDFATLCGDIVGDEMSRFGVHLWLAPALNIHRSIRCGRNFEYYSEDPVVSGKIASAITRGVQSHRGCGVTVKHFCANNQETNRYGNNSIVSERAMREIYLKGFAICIKEADPVAVMTSYNLVNSTHTAEHKGLIHDYLRCELGYDGLVMTDWIVYGGIMADKKDRHPRTTAWKIADAGGDLIMPGCKKDVCGILMGLDSQSLSRERLEKNGTRVYKTAKKLKLI